MRETQITFEDELSRTINPAAGITEPALWFKELTIVRKLEPVDNEGNLIRKFKFKPGLNILWAEPEEVDKNASLYNDSYAGHSTGKTLFCRVLRFLLNEPNFGTAELQKHVAETFLSLWAIAEIRVQKQSWIVARNLIDTGVHFAIKGANVSIDRVLGNTPGYNGYKDFTDALENLCPMELRGLYPREAWRNLIPWLARDQEERFASITNWRSSLSEADNPRTKKEARHLLLRTMLDLLDPKEYQLRADITTSTGSIQELESKLPLKKQSSEQAESRTQTLLAKIPAINIEKKNLQEAKNYVVKQREIREESLEHFENLPEHDEVLNARRELQKATNEKAVQESRLNFLKIEIPNLKEQVNKKLVSVNRLKSSGLQDPSRVEKNWCPNSYHTACEKGCFTPPHDGDTTMLQLSELEEEAKSLRQDYQAKITEQENLESQLDQSDAHIEIKQSALTAVIKKHPSPAVKIQKDIDLLVSLETNLDELINAQNDLQAHSEDLQKTQKNLAKQRKKLVLLRESTDDRLNCFSEIFGDIIRAVVGSSVSGSVNLTESGLKPKITKKRELGGAAMETVKTIAFDLASIIHSAEGRGSHPRFLIHDGPRESDMAQVMYEHFFHYVQRMENAFKKEELSFQYILTTTTPPPEGMRENSEWLLGKKLSGKSTDGRLLRADF